MMKNILFDHLKYSPIFAKLDPFMFQTVEQRLEFRELAPQEILFNEGETGNYMAFILVGQLLIFKHTHQDDIVKLGHIGAGDSIGEMALIDDLSRSASAMALEPTALVVLSKADFETILTDYPRIGVEMLRGLSTMLSLKLRRTSENLSRHNS